MAHHKQFWDSPQGFDTCHKTLTSVFHRERRGQWVTAAQLLSCFNCRDPPTEDIVESMCRHHKDFLSLDQDGVTYFTWRGAPPPTAAPVPDPLPPKTIYQKMKERHETKGLHRQQTGTSSSSTAVAGQPSSSSSMQTTQGNPTWSLTTSLQHAAAVGMSTHEWFHVAVFVNFCPPAQPKWGGCGCGHFSKWTVPPVTALPRDMPQFPHDEDNCVDGGWWSLVVGWYQCFERE